MTHFREQHHTDQNVSISCVIICATCSYFNAANLFGGGGPKNRFGSEERIESNQNFLLELECSTDYRKTFPIHSKGMCINFNLCIINS